MAKLIAEIVSKVAKILQNLPTSSDLLYNMFGANVTANVCGDWCT
jgi:hypothetical protein